MRPSVRTSEVLSVKSSCGILVHTYSRLTSLCADCSSHCCPIAPISIAPMWLPSRGDWGDHLTTTKTSSITTCHGWHVWKFSDFTGGIHTDLRILPVDFTGGIQGEAFVDLRRGVTWLASGCVAVGVWQNNPG